MDKWYELLVCTSDIEIRFLCGNIYGMLFSIFLFNSFTDHWNPELKSSCSNSGQDGARMFQFRGQFLPNKKLTIDKSIIVGVIELYSAAEGVVYY